MANIISPREKEIVRELLVTAKEELKQADKDVNIAKAHQDLRENAAYDEAVNQHSIKLSKVKELETLLSYKTQAPRSDLILAGNYVTISYKDIPDDLLINASEEFIHSDELQSFSNKVLITHHLFDLDMGLLPENAEIIKGVKGKKSGVYRVTPPIGRSREVTYSVSTQ